jgi:hypothetical protein
LAWRNKDDPGAAKDSADIFLRHRILLAAWNVLRLTVGGFEPAWLLEEPMKVTVVRYKAKDGSGDENARLIKNVFGELERKSPAGFHYVALRLEDGTFIHFAVTDDAAAPNPLRDVDAFRVFQTGIAERCAEPPQACGAVVVGSYKFFA